MKLYHSNYMMKTRWITAEFLGILMNRDMWKRMRSYKPGWLNAAYFSCFSVGAYTSWRWSRPPMLSCTLFWRPKLCPSLRTSQWVRRWALLISWFVVMSIHTEPEKVTSVKWTACDHNFIIFQGWNSLSCVRFSFNFEKSSWSLGLYCGCFEC